MTRWTGFWRLRCAIFSSLAPGDAPLLMRSQTRRHHSPLAPKTCPPEELRSRNRSKWGINMFSLSKNILWFWAV